MRGERRFGSAGAGRRLPRQPLSAAARERLSGLAPGGVPRKGRLKAGQPGLGVGTSAGVSPGAAAVLR
jgi:hypothetical protein